MDKHHIILIILLTVSEVCGAIPERYVWMNGFLDVVCKVLKDLYEKPESCDARNMDTPSLT